ncbi:hypothetical protein SAMN05444678_112111 [Sphingomonas sp. YR710]|uniref:DcaP family trimeric outer membrane transporter n=1 Tax=Sphingomonas sp. YR710 TaxID=1882773 RepID=UPI000880C560|nr:DcaP family trimeric outer membrane transporter [Sphingomonas sp. YR710]SDD36877.1 hypothetical protein SAMN05444678_112111 [Sphingomonas sp. YR710]
MGNWRNVAGLLAASALIAPQAALAKNRHESELEARVAKLEAEIAEMHGALEAGGKQAHAIAAAQTAADDAAKAAAAAQAQALAAATSSAQTATKLARFESAPLPEGIRDGNTTIKLGGYLKMIAANSHFGDGPVATNSLGRDFYLPQAIPTGGRAATYADATAKQTRLWLNFASTVAGHQVKGYLETDFQTTANAAPTITGGGSQRTTNGYTLALRRAFMTVDRFTFGQEWTTFQYVGALPESTDYVGGVEGTVFVRQPQIRYSAPLTKSVTLNIAVENPESSTATPGSPTLVENGTDHLPDFTARLAVAGTYGELSLAALARQIRLETAGVGATATGYGVSAAGKLWLNHDKTSDIRFMATYGKDIGRYVGLNFAPDAVYVAASGRLEDVKIFAAIAAARIPITPQLRINLMGSFQKVSYAGALQAANLATFNKRAWSVAGNLFYSPVKNVDLGVEYRHGERELVSGVSGAVGRLEFAAKYGF